MHCTYCSSSFSAAALICGIPPVPSVADELPPHGHRLVDHCGIARASTI